MSYIKDGKIEITYRKKSDILLSIGAAVMALLCLIVGLLSEPIDLEALSSRTALVFGALFFGAGFAFFAKRVYDGFTLITADRRGITENSTPYSLGETILWRSVQGISLEENNGKTFIAVELSNFDNYLGRLSERKRKLFEENTAAGYRYVTVTAAGTKTSLDELYSDLMILWRKSAGIDSPEEE